MNDNQNQKQKQKKCDSGFIRYYELPPLADVTMSEEADSHHVNMVIKDTLIIHHARIIDVTTLRDLHVGLPRGSYGFLFRGQRISGGGGGGIGGGGNNNNLDVGDIVGQHYSAFGDYNMQQDVGSQSCSTKPVGGGEVNPPREYFCAVSTLEEAQSWVIALQWSVAVCQKTMLRHSLSDSDNDNDTDNDHKNLTREGKKNNSNDYSAKTITSIATPTSTTTTTANSNKQSKSGRILVTKVFGFRIIQVDNSTKSTMTKRRRNGSSKSNSSTDDSTSSDVSIFRHYFHCCRWEVAYEVALLLVEKTSSKVEERRILLTAMQLGVMLEEMSKSIKRNRTIMVPFLDDLQQQTENLPRFICNNRNRSKNNYYGECTPEIFEASVAKMDGILRALAMEAVAVNSVNFRQVFALDIDRPPIEEVCWWKKQKCSSIGGGGSRTINSNKLEEKPDRIITPVFFRQVRPIPSTVSMDDYVRQWLTRPTSSSYAVRRRWQLRAQFWIFQRPWLLVGTFGVVLALIYPVSQIYQRNMTSITIRLDILLVACGISYWLGQRRTQPTKQRKSRYSYSSRGTARNAAPTSSVRMAESKIMDEQESGSNQSFPSNNVPISSDTSQIISKEEDTIEESPSDESVLDGEDLDYLDCEFENDENSNVGKLSSPIPQYPDNDGSSCWSEPPDPAIFHVRGSNYLEDKVKIPSGRSPFKCRGVDLWMTDNPERHIARHPNVLGGKIHEEDTFLVNFLLPFGNFVAYFSVPPISEFPNKEVASVWSSFVDGDQQYRDARLKLLPVVIDGPWIVKAAVGNGKAPALLGKVIPLQYFFRKPEGTKKGIYEVDVIITASSIAKGILSVVKGQSNSLTIAFALIIEAATHIELPETVLCSYQIHALNLDDCPHLPDFNLDDVKE